MLIPENSVSFIVRSRGRKGEAEPDSSFFFSASGTPSLRYALSSDRYSPPHTNFYVSSSIGGHSKRHLRGLFTTPLFVPLLFERLLRRPPFSDQLEIQDSVFPGFKSRPVPPPSEPKPRMSSSQTPIAALFSSTPSSLPRVPRPPETAPALSTLPYRIWNSRIYGRGCSRLPN